VRPARRERDDLVELVAPADMNGDSVRRDDPPGIRDGDVSQRLDGFREAEELGGSVVTEDRARSSVQ